MGGWLEALAPQLAADVGAFVSTQRAPGAAAGVVVDGELAWKCGFGFADLEEERVPDERTLFRVGSVTKTFTATAIMQLRDEGLLRLDDPVAVHIPELEKARNPFGPMRDVTLRRLLMHRSGLMSDPPLEDWTAGLFPSVTETLGSPDTIEVVVRPESATKYSNLGYQLLGEVVARASGSPYRDHVRARILEPLAMLDSGFDPPPGSPVAVGYDALPYEERPRTSVGRRRVTEAEGGLWSSVADLARWEAFQLDGGPALHVDTLREMQRATLLTDDAWTSAVGLGWYQVRRNDAVWVGHQGGTPGFSCRIAFSVPHRIGIVVLLNGDGPATELAMALADRLLVARRAMPVPVGPSSPPAPAPDELRPYLGAYAWPEFGEGLRVEWREGALRLRWNRGAEPAPALEPTDESDAFVVRGGDGSGERCRFVRDTGGRIVAIRVATYTLVRLHPDP